MLTVPRTLIAILCAAALSPLAGAEITLPEKDNTIELTGTLRTGIMAIGAETTAIQITLDDKTTYELDLAKNEKLLELAQELNGKKVYVKGEIITVKGVERGPRKVVRVSILRKTDEKTATSLPSK